MGISIETSPFLGASFFCIRVYKSIWIFLRHFLSLFIVGISRRCGFRHFLQAWRFFIPPWRFFIPTVAFFHTSMKRISRLFIRFLFRFRVPVLQGYHSIFSRLRGYILPVAEINFYSVGSSALHQEFITVDLFFPYPMG